MLLINVLIHVVMKDFPIAPAKTKTQMAEEYGIDIRTFNKRLDLVGIKLPRGLIFPKDQMRIYKALGPPL
jgi:hypothetical protein